MLPLSLTLEPMEILQNIHSKDFVPESCEFIEPRQVFVFYPVTLNPTVHETYWIYSISPCSIVRL